MASTVDIAPADVRVNGNLVATKARVFWVDGHLYVARSSTNVTRYELAEAPEKGRDGLYRVDSLGMSFRKNGCGTCGYVLGRVPRLRLMEVAN